ncbi:Transducin/WD40 repeat-like superfamily protein, putative isoform 2 [Hibiscus syriacus]|uniref:Transducin/WD40 repeat-like superfamily protein, putative isoform 2 n=1 Tax=Hibiscus syriacus TaxID=106335 RepID=A0A6A2YPW5_HIBSY|nr:Transducin/WD40 repeat-like superfamily protein, putative isoform 2 [Hibiscus syriacus]
MIPQGSWIECKKGKITGSYLEEEDQFFYTREEISSASEKCGSSPDLGLIDDLVDSFDQYKFWSTFRESIDKRRHNFGKRMSLRFNANSITEENPGGSGRAELELGISTISEESWAVLRTSGLEEGVSSYKPSYWFNDAQEPDHLAHQTKNLDGQIELAMAEQSQNGIRSHSEYRPAIGMKRKVKKSWLRKLGATAHIVDRHVEVLSKPSNHELTSEEKMKRVRPHPSSKHSKELSSLYCGQEFVAHEGFILTMKFSLDGEFLATAVISVAFKDDNYFISGSIDGKVRFWEVLCCRVIDYTNVRDIVTAVCYRPDGKGGIVGSMTRSCRFYNIIGMLSSILDFNLMNRFNVRIDTRLQLDEPIYLQGKKKLPGKRVTGFEFFPSDPSKVMITSADSPVIVLSGRDVLHNASVAIPWRGIETNPAMLASLELGGDGRKNSLPKMEPEQPKPHSSLDCFSLPRVLLGSLTKGSPTWPEETLPNASAGTVASDVCRFELKVLKSAYQSMLSSHKWGLVIVAAGWVGRIRTYLNYGLPIRL